MTTQPHAIPSKQDELAGLYDQELEAMFDRPLDCLNADGPATFRIGHISCTLGIVCVDCAEKAEQTLERDKARGATYSCQECGATPLTPDEIDVVPL